MKTLEPLKITPSKDYGPYEYQTKLAQCNVGPIQNAGHQHSLKRNRVSVKDAPTGKLARHHFLIEKAGKDMSIEQIFEQEYYNDFNEKVTQIGKIDQNIEQLSKNDKRFLEILDQVQGRMGTAVRHHCHSTGMYQVPQITEAKL